MPSMLVRETSRVKRTQRLQRMQRSLSSWMRGLSACSLRLRRFGSFERDRGEPEGELVILQAAFAGLVADAAIDRVIEHHELHDRLPRAQHLGRGRLHLHLGGDMHVARGHQLGDALHLDQAHAAIACDRQVRVIAEVRDLDAIAQRGLQQLLALGGFDRAIVDRELHASSSNLQATVVQRAAVLDEVFELGPKFLEEAQDRHRGRIAQRAQRVAENAFGDALQILEVRALACACHDALDDAVHPRRCPRGTARTARTIRGCRSA